MTTLLDLVPEPRRDLAHAALVAAFGHAPLTSIAPVTGGVSGALVYRLGVAERPYLLRMETARDAFRDSRRGFAAMKIAADAGIAPALHHLDPETGVAIMDFIQARPLEAYPGGKPALVGEIGAMIGRLQQTPLFPALGDYPVILRRLLGYLAASPVFAPGLLAPYQEGLERIAEVYPWDPAAMVSSHNDPNPRNILFDGQRLWLIDWETAFRNDPLIDLAIQTHEIATTPGLEDVLITAWSGRAPDALTKARLVLARQLTRLYYGCIVLSSLLAAPPPEPMSDLAAMTPDQLRAAVMEGRLTVGDPKMVLEFGKIFLAAFKDGLGGAAFEEALATSRLG